MEIAKKCRNVPTTRAQVSQVARGGGPWLEIKLGGSGRGAHRETQRAERCLGQTALEQIEGQTSGGIPQVTVSSGLFDWIRSQLVQEIRKLWMAQARRPSRWTESDSIQEMIR